mmetsp:Transcript_33767/g.86601  ORF Transcript_33767/g.86601 Transcript_33767/m.86601 type:complete len:301 (-) Transcript_33767:85-987(-)
MEKKRPRMRRERRTYHSGRSPSEGCDSDDDVIRVPKLRKGVSWKHMKDDIGIKDITVRRIFTKTQEDYENGNVSGELTSSEGCLEPQAVFSLLSVIPDLRNDERVMRKLIQDCISCLRELEKERSNGRLPGEAFKSYLFKAFGGKDEVKMEVDKIEEHCRKEHDAEGGIKGLHTRTDVDRHFHIARLLLIASACPDDKNLGKVYENLSQENPSLFPLERQDEGKSVIETIKRDRKLVERYRENRNTPKESDIRTTCQKPARQKDRRTVGASFCVIEHRAHQPVPGSVSLHFSPSHLTSSY